MKVNKQFSRLRWRRKGRIMSKSKFYGSNLHFQSEASYPQYKEAYKVRYKK